MCVFYDGNSRRLNQKWCYGEAGTSHGIALTITKLIDFFSEVELLICLPLFLLKMNQNAKS